MTTYRPREEMYLASVETPRIAVAEHGHFTLRERRQPKRKIASARVGISSFDPISSKVGEMGGRISTGSIFAPSRKPVASAGTSFMRDTGRVGAFNPGRGSTVVRSTGALPRPGSKATLIDVAEVNELGKSSRSREQEAKEKRIQRLMEERDARQQLEDSRKRQRDEEIAAKKKAYKAEIEAKRARKERDSSSIATPSPTDEPTMW